MRDATTYLERLITGKETMINEKESIDEVKEVKEGEEAEEGEESVPSRSNWWHQWAEN